ncbi:putative Kinase binding protein CGI-121 [Leishmania utingensis]|uniref:Kinase binding protein CGI-121 n=1 Tax=Leishmania utingensis TaxID=653362 RepID=A0AAW3AGK5_9TRYP
MSLRIGSFAVRCYHDCTNAAAIHAEMKRRHIDAAVVDHAFLFSPLQLAVALFRVEASADALATRVPSTISLLSAEAPSPSSASTDTSLPSSPPQQQQQQQLAHRLSSSRQIFAALSLSHNLDRILQVLPPGPQTTSVVIIYKYSGSTHPAAVSATDDVRADSVVASAVQDGENLDAIIHACVQVTNSTAQSHTFAPITEPFWTGSAFALADASKVALFYGISESMLLAAQRSMTRLDVRRVCLGTPSQAAQMQLLRWHALEICVTTLLAACTA